MDTGGSIQGSRTRLRLLSFDKFLARSLLLPDCSDPPLSFPTTITSLRSLDNNGIKDALLAQSYAISSLFLFLLVPLAKFGHRILEQSAICSMELVQVIWHHLIHDQRRRLDCNTRVRSRHENSHESIN